MMKGNSAHKVLFALGRINTSPENRGQVGISRKSARARFEEWHERRPHDEKKALAALIIGIFSRVKAPHEADACKNWPSAGDVQRFADAVANDNALAMKLGKALEIQGRKVKDWKNFEAGAALVDLAAGFFGVFLGAAVIADAFALPLREFAIDAKEHALGALVACYLAFRAFVVYPVKSVYGENSWLRLNEIIDILRDGRQGAA